MDGSDFADRFVPLQGGVVMPVEPWRLLHELVDARGFSVTRDAGDVLVVRPADRLTTEDVARIRRWKWHLLLLLDYGARPDLDAHVQSDDVARPHFGAIVVTRKPQE